MPGYRESSEDADRRAHKLEELARTYRAVGDHFAFGVQGFAQLEYRCTVCGTRRLGPKQPAADLLLHCEPCGVTHVHERVW